MTQSIVETLYLLHNTVHFHNTLGTHVREPLT